MSNINLDYFKDTNGKYIIRNETNNEYNNENFNTLVKNEGEFSENFIISNTFFNKKLKHKIEDTVKEIRRTLIIDNRIEEKDIVSEKFLLEVTPEEEFNPFFKSLTLKESKEYTKNSSKVRVVINWEMFIKPKTHLLLSGIKGSIKNFFK